MCLKILSIIIFERAGYVCVDKQMRQSVFSINRKSYKYM